MNRRWERAQQAERGAGLLEAITLNLLLVAANLSALDSRWAGWPVWPASWALCAWYLTRLFLAWRHGWLSHFLLWHVIALLPLIAASVIGTILALPFVLPVLSEAADAGLSGIFLLVFAALPLMWSFFFALPLAVWLTRRWLPGRPAFGHAWRDTVLGLTGLSLITLLPMFGMRQLAELVPCPEPEVVVHPAEEYRVIHWVLNANPHDMGRYTLEQCQQTAPQNRYGYTVPVSDCRVVDQGRLFEGEIHFQLFDPAKLPKGWHRQRLGLFLCRRHRQGGNGSCNLAWIPATPAENPSTWPRDAILLNWGLVGSPPRLPDRRILGMRIEACKSMWLPGRREQCMGVSDLFLSAPGSGMFLTSDIDNLFYPRNQRLQELLAGPDQVLYLHVWSEQDDIWSRLGMRPAQRRDDYYPLRILPFPGGSTQWINGK